METSASSFIHYSMCNRQCKSWCAQNSCIHSFKDLRSTSSRKLLRGAPDSRTVKKEQCSCDYRICQKVPLGRRHRQKASERPTARRGSDCKILKNMLLIGGLICGSCEQAYPGSQTYVGLLVS